MGLLLALGLPLLILFSWNRLGAQTGAIQLERYENWSALHLTPKLLHPLNLHFRKHKTLALPGEAALPPVPKDSGIKAWALQPDTVLRIELDAKEGGKPVVLRYVPVLKSDRGVHYDCVSDHPPTIVARFCRAEWLPSAAEVPAQLEANARFLQAMPTESTTAAGTPLRAGATGTVVAVPARVEDLGNCGYQCVSMQSCVTPRPLACGRLTSAGGGSTMEVMPTREDVRGSSFAAVADADQACVQAQGEGSRVLRASSIWGRFQLTGGHEYWVHDDLRAENNCWR